jgi:hypothetical protein
MLFALVVIALALLVILPFFDTPPSISTPVHAAEPARRAPSDPVPTTQSFEQGD